MVKLNMSMGNYFSVPLLSEHCNNTVPETIVTMKSYGLCLYLDSPGKNFTVTVARFEDLGGQERK